MMSEGAQHTPDVTPSTLPKGYPSPPFKPAADVFLFTDQCKRPIYSFKRPLRPRITDELLDSISEAYKQAFYEAGTSLSVGRVACEGYGLGNTSEDDSLPKATFPGQEVYELAHQELLAVEVIRISYGRAAQSGHGEAVLKMIRRLHPETEGIPIHLSSTPPSLYTQPLYPSTPPHEDPSPDPSPSPTKRVRTGVKSMAVSVDPASPESHNIFDSHVSPHLDAPASPSKLGDPIEFASSPTPDQTCATPDMLSLLDGKSVIGGASIGTAESPARSGTLGAWLNADGVRIGLTSHHVLPTEGLSVLSPSPSDLATHLNSSKFLPHNNRETQEERQALRKSLEDAPPIGRVIYSQLYYLPATRLPPNPALSQAYNRIDIALIAPNTPSPFKLLNRQVMNPQGLGTTFGKPRDMEVVHMYGRTSGKISGRITHYDFCNTWCDGSQARGCYDWAVYQSKGKTVDIGDSGSIVLEADVGKVVGLAHGGDDDFTFFTDITIVIDEIKKKMSYSDVRFSDDVGKA